ncbi:hypothetical protein BDA99DRAFT_531882 [Phascolomyces articulosus]|uniref:Chitin-binding type-2 domain-containing protein n=1 Tax=Phascolomyces articulosus TaxID=60185 RepID=A0AAD5KAN1_9FUNG|nr:hypothetical protein BDA99DRAFT_531882 [Phascolomyces articulosus]
MKLFTLSRTFAITLLFSTLNIIFVFSTEDSFAAVNQHPEKLLQKQKAHIPDLCSDFKKGGKPYAAVHGSCTEYYQCIQSMDKTMPRHCDYGTMFNEEIGKCVPITDKSEDCHDHGEYPRKKSNSNKLAISTTINNNMLLGVIAVGVIYPNQPFLLLLE